MNYNDLLVTIHSVIDDKSKYSDVEREIVNYRVQGLDYKEISDKTNCKIKKVDNTMTKFRRDLREVLGKDD